MAEKVFGALVTVIYLVFVGWSYTAMFVGWSNLDYWADRYQTLIVGTTALASVFYLPHAVRVTIDREFYEMHSDSVEFWTPGSPTFPDLAPMRRDS